MDPKKRILIVDNEPAMVELLRAVLEEQGYEVHEAADGKAALEKIETALPHLIISDVMMPGMDGFSFLKELKRSKLTSHIPVIIVTARGKMEDSFSAFGTEEFITKPYFSQDVIDKVAWLLAKPVAQAVIRDEDLDIELKNDPSIKDQPVPDLGKALIVLFVIAAVIAGTFVVMLLITTANSGKLPIERIGQGKALP